jgi:hypothetical protein
MDEFGEVRVDGRLAAQQSEFRRHQPSRPWLHPRRRLVRGDRALVAMIRIMRAALAAQIAAVRDMQLKVWNAKRALSHPPSIGLPRSLFTHAGTIGVEGAGRRE